MLCWLQATMAGASATHKQRTLNLRWVLFGFISTSLQQKSEQELDRHLIGALQAEPLSYFIRGCDLERKLFQNAADLFHLFRTGRRQHTLAQIKTVFEANPDVAAQKRRQGHDPYLVTSGAERRPLVVFPSEEPVRSCLDVAEQLDVGPHSSKNAEDRLQKEGRLDQLLVKKIGQVVEMAQIVALVFKPGAASFSQFLQNPLHIHKRIAEDMVLGRGQVRLLPLVFPLAISPCQAVDGEVHGAHVERRQLWLDAQRRRQPLIQAHGH